MPVKRTARKTSTAAKSKAPARRKLVQAIYPLHTGQLGGMAGRVVVLLNGFCVLALLALGVGLWSTRRVRQ